MFNIEINDGSYTAEDIFREYNDLMTVEELMKALRMGRNSAYKLIASGEVQDVPNGRVHRILKSSVIDYINKKLSDNCSSDCKQENNEESRPVLGNLTRTVPPNSVGKHKPIRLPAVTGSERKP